MYRNLRFLHIPAKTTIFNYGDIGDLFYIIMEGEVIIKTPSPVDLEGSHAEPLGFIAFLLGYYKDIQWKSFPNRDKVQDLLHKELELFGVKVDVDGNFDSDNALETLSKVISLGRS